MIIILSPAKKMNVDTDKIECQDLPVFLDQTKEILAWLKNQSRADLQKLWECNDQIAEQNYKRIVEMNLHNRLTPAILSYEGIAFQYMAPAVMVKGKLVTKGTYAKMARGEMVRYMAENKIEDPGDIKNFDRLGYVYRDDISNETEIVFERRG